MSVYDFTVKAQDGKDVPLSNYKGKILLIVNTATACGFTPQYSELQKLYQKYKDADFEILDFPCNQFAEQAPGTDGEIHSFCTGRFGITFPQFSKIEVIGNNAIPLYKWLSENTKFIGFDSSPLGEILDSLLIKTDPDYKNNNAIKWNFTKFLIDRDGNIISRFEPTFSLNKIATRIEEIL